jgi:hypothetical protein
MKSIHSYLIFLIESTLLICLSCRTSYPQSNISEGEAIKMLKNFYTGYISIISRDGALRINEIDSIISKYCTRDLAKEIQDKTLSRELDYDPFLNAQFSMIEWLKTLNIRKDSTRNNIYYVSYIYGNKIRRTKLGIVKEKGEYKIDYIYLKDFKEESIDRH